MNFDCNYVMNIEKVFEMKRFLTLFSLLLFVFPVFIMADVIVTTDHVKHEGVVKKRLEKGWVIQTKDNQMVLVPTNKIWKIYRGDTYIDFKEKMRYKVKVGRPYMPLAILGIASGIYSVTEFNRYSKNKKEADQLEGDAGADWTGKSNQALATGIVSGIVCVGSMYIAFKPVEMKIPMGKVQISAMPNQIHLSLHF